jgi:hypothetical protein
MRRYVPLVSVLCLAVACGAEPTPTPDLVATQIAEQTSEVSEDLGGLWP